MPITRRLVKGSELTYAEGDGNLDALDRASPVVLTISSGAITVTGPGTYRVETEGAASTDDLTTINGSQGREWEIKLRLNTAGRVITVVHSTGAGMYLQGGNSFLLNSVRDILVLQDRVTNEWSEVSRSSNP